LASQAELSFLLIAPDRVDTRHWAAIAAASVAFHLLLGLILVPLAKAPLSRRSTGLRIVPERRLLVTPLVTPPAALTQKEANRNPLSTEFNVASIAPRPRIA